MSSLQQDACPWGSTALLTSVEGEGKALQWAAALISLSQRSILPGEGLQGPTVKCLAGCVCCL